MNTLWVVLIFLLGAATGALTVSIYRLATIARTKEQFQADIEKILEEHSNPMAGTPVPPAPANGKTKEAA